jgi:CRP-like cAMP-binding protein
MARSGSVIDHLAAVPMFAACSKREAQAVCRAATEIDVPAGKALTTEGERGQEFIIVISGKAVADRGGKEVATFGPGDYFGEIALLDPGPRTATVVAETPMTVAVVAQRDFAQLLADVPTLSTKILRGLARRLRDVGDSQV